MLSIVVKKVSDYILNSARQVASEEVRVAEVKKMLEMRSGVPTHLQSLVVGGRALDGRSASSHIITALTPTTVEPPNNGHIGIRSFVLYREILKAKNMWSYKVEKEPLSKCVSNMKKLSFLFQTPGDCVTMASNLATGYS